MTDLRKCFLLVPRDILSLIWAWCAFRVWVWEAKLDYSNEALQDFYQSRDFRFLSTEDLMSVKDCFESLVEEAKENLDRYRRFKRSLRFIIDQRLVLASFSGDSYTGDF